MKRLAVVFIAIFTTAWISSVVAQTETPKVDKREHRQQGRIREGVKSGELTPAETKRLEAQQAKIHRDEKKAKADGVVSPQERAKLQREQNRAGKTIYRKKHNLRDSN